MNLSFNSSKFDNLLESQQALFDKIKGYSKAYYSCGDFDAAINSIRACATIAANINFSYSDDDLEALLERIANSLINVNVESLKSQNLKKIVFYDGFGYSNVPLSLQYIRALIANKYEFLYIYEEINSPVDAEIYKELTSYPFATTYSLSASLSPSKKIIEGYNVIKEYNPTSALLHLGEVHVEAVSIFSLLNTVVKFRINLGDHQFWLGVNQLDYTLEFRSYGATISSEMRMIPAEKILYQPYYPFLDARPFNGFSFNINPDDVVMFSGGRLYKIFGRDYEFFSVIKRLLNENPKLIFILAGKNGGDVSYIDDFILKNRFKNRFYYIGHRHDINEVFKRCDLFLNTYPQSGGLMCMYAAMNKKPILTYTTSDLPENNTEMLLYQYSSDNKITFTNSDDFFTNASQLINDKLLRDRIGAELPQFVINKSEFNVLLNDNLQNKRSYEFDPVGIDYGALIKLNIEMERDFYNMTSYALIKCYKWKVFLLFPTYSYKIAKFVISFLRKK